MNSPNPHHTPASMKIAALAISILTLITSITFAQQGRGTIQGIVVDAGGASIAGARVTITNTATNLVFTAVTGEEGFYIVPNLIVGSYSVTVTKEGFKKAVHNGIVIEVDQKAEINISLAPGAVNESVEVTAEAPLIDTATATVGKVIENRRVQELPVNGRNALALVLLAPSVQSAVGPHATGFADRGTQVSSIRINGSPIATNNFIVDGLSSVNAYLPDVNVNPTVDAVQEFKVMTNTMSSEFGFTLGGVVNLVTKSGTNLYHGALYEFFRNDALDANTWSNNRASRSKQPLRYHQFGGAIGGPIRLPQKVFGPMGFDGRDRSFFFFNYEGYRFITSTSGFYTMPTEAFRRGDFSQLRNDQGTLITIYNPDTTRPNPNYDSTRPVTGGNQPFLRDPFPGNIIPEGRIDQVARNILRFYPLPNRAPDNQFGNLNNYFGAVSNNRNLNQYTSRVDHRLSEQNSLLARYTFYRQFTDMGLTNLYPDPTVRLRNDPFRGHNIVLENIHSFTPGFIHTIRLGVARQSFEFKVASADQDWPGQLGLPPIVPPDTFPLINNGLPAFNSGVVGVRGGTIWQLFDSITLLKGNHSFKFGTELRLIQANNLQKGSPSGNFTFPSSLTTNAVQTPGGAANTGSQFASFLLGEVGSASVTTHLGESEVGKSYSFFFQDDWKATRRLTLNLGVRYDYQQMPYERRCGTSNFDPFASNPDNGLPGLTEYACLDYGRTAMKEDKDDFSPRIGFAIDLFGNQRTVLRGGYSIFYPAVWAFYNNIYGSTNGFASTSTSYNPPNGNTLFSALKLKDGFPFAPNQPQGSLLGPNLFATSGANHQEAEGSTPMSQQWNVSIQQQLPAGILLEATYSANHGTHLFAGSYDLNQADPARIAEFGLQGRLNETVQNPYAGKVPGQFGGATITRAQSLRPYPYVGEITIRNPRLGNSIYHSLLLSGEKRFSKGFAFLASYTFGKLISDSVSNPLNFIPTEGAGEFGYQNGKYNRRAERAEDPSNVPHRLVISGLWELPIGSNRALDLKNGPLNAVLGNWQLNTVTTIVSGTPLVVRGATNGLANRPNLASSPRRVPDGFNDALLADPANDLGVLWFDPSTFLNPPDYTYGNVARSLSGVRNPGAFISDLSIFKTFSITEKVKMQFRVEAFNFLNHSNLLAPNASFGNNAGEVTGEGLPVTVSTQGVATITRNTPVIYGDHCLGRSRTVRLDGNDTTVFRNQCNTNVSFGRILGSRDPRQMQFGLKITF
jgi:Carboxypeptidase regulatory-like domain